MIFKISHTAGVSVSTCLHI